MNTLRKIALTILVGMVGFYAFSQATVRAMSFNIRYDEPNDGEHNWKFRKANAAKVIQFHDIDIVGMQEVLHTQLMDLKVSLPGYSFIGQARDDGNTAGEYSPVLYRSDKFKLNGHGTFWLSETPNKPSFGWDAACRRVVSWAILKERKTGKEIAFFNTHFDHKGQEARRNSAILLVSKVSEIAGKRPVIITGDFNGTPNSEPITIILDAKNPIALINTSKVAQITYGPVWTFHNFGRAPLQERTEIDYVFISKHFSVHKYGVLAEAIDGVYLSDHCPVMVELIQK
jgi:endonuclease/exonuclease/phosphatase family metal-dependent hydrolase